jgi:hypothetical protein
MGPGLFFCRQPRDQAISHSWPRAANVLREPTAAEQLAHKR